MKFIVVLLIDFTTKGKTRTSWIILMIAHASCAELPLSNEPKIPIPIPDPVATWAVTVLEVESYFGP